MNKRMISSLLLGDKLGLNRHRLVVFWLSFAAAYYVLWWAAALLGSFDNQISLWYPVAGLRFFVLLMFGWAALLPVLLIETALSLALWWFYYDSEFAWISLLFTGALLLSLYLVAALVLRAWQRPQAHSFADPVYVARFLGIALLVCGLAAFIGVSILVYFGRIVAEHYGAAVLTWWVGDFIGLITVTPLLMVYLRPRLYAWLQADSNWLMPPTAVPYKRERFWVLGSVSALVLGLWALFQLSDWIGIEPLLCPFLLLLIILPLGVAALSGGPRLATVLVFILASLLPILMIWQQITEWALYYQLIIITAAMTGLMLGALSSARQRALTHLADLHQIVHDLLWDTDAQGRVIGLSGQLATTIPARLGQPWRQVVHHIPRAERQILRTALRQHRAFRGVNLTVHHATQGCRWWRVDGMPYWDELGRLAGYRGVATDITERQRVEQALLAQRAAEAANHSKSAFLAHISHEIRTPMNAIIGFTHILARDPQLNRQQRDQVQTIDHSARHLLNLLNDILDFSRIESGRLTLQEQAFDLQQLLSELRQLFLPRAQAKGLSLELVCEQAVPRYIMADAGKLRQVLMNLIGNAVKFTTDGRIVIHAHVEQSRLRLEVSDTGPGISAADQAEIFDAFRQTAATQHSGGSGLGLAISRELVTLMGGVLTVHSRPAQGSCFSVDLPLNPAHAPSQEDATLREPTSVSEPEVTAIPALSRADMAVLSRAQIDAMREALEQGDLNALNQQLAVIATRHESLAQALQQLVAQYDYTTLNTLLE